MQRLSGMDASFLYLETPSHHMHVVGVVVLDPSGMHGGFTVERVRALIRARVHLMPMLRRRLVEVPLGLNHPVWIEDPDFNLDSHILHLAAPRPGSMRELADVVGGIASRPLDRSRPLWEMYLVDGLEGGTAALVTKMHHATIDGITGADVMAHLLDLERDAGDPPPPDEPWTPDRVPSELDLVLGALGDRARNPLRGAQALARTTRSLVEMGAGLLPIGGGTLSTAMPFSGPRTKLSAAITGNRGVAFGQAELDHFKVIKTAFGTTVNDVVLAATTASLRRWLLAHDHLPERPLVAAVPVSVHADASTGGTNQVSNMFVRLPIHLDDPVEQLQAIRTETKDAKAMHNAMGADLIQDLAQITPPGVYNLAMRIYAIPQVADSLPPVQNLVISNVPGPPIPLYIAGATVKGIYPFGPLIEGSGINVTVLSNMGNVDIGVIACPDTVPEIASIVEGFTKAIDDLRVAAAMV